MAFDITRVRRDFGDVDAEWSACRHAAALFDFSFMARARVSGPGALSLIEHFAARSLSTMPAGAIRYALRSDRRGCLVADLTVWRLGDDEFEVMSGRHADIVDLAALASRGVVVTDLTGETAVLALQGPGALDALDGLTDTAVVARVGYYRHVAARIGGVPCRIGRLGYTGEPGFEIVIDRRDAHAITGCLAARTRLAGFASADMLRIEAGFILFANEFQLAVTAEECGLGKFRSGTADQGELMLVCLTGATAMRPLLWQPPAGLKRPERAGEIAVTSACWSPLAGAALLLGFARRADIATGIPLHDPTGTFAALRMTGMPYFDPEKSRPRRLWPGR